MTMIQTYLSHLRSYLPDELKQEVSDELEASLLARKEDMEEELNRPLTDNEQADLLQRMGHPMKVASAYLPNQQLIGPELFPMYKKALEFGLVICVVLTFLLSIPEIVESNRLISSGIAIVFDAIDNGIFIFALITIGFYCLPKNQETLNFLYAWSPENLTRQQAKLPISRLESIFEAIIYGLFFAWWLNLISFPSDVTVDGNTLILKLSDEWSHVYWPIAVITAGSIVLSLHKFVLAGWNQISLFADILLNLVTLGLLIYIAQMNSFVSFGEVLTQQVATERLIEIVNSVVYSTLAIIAAISIWDIYQDIRNLRQQ